MDISISNAFDLDLEFERFQKEIEELITPLSPERKIIPIVHATPESVKVAESLIRVSGLKLKFTPTRDAKIKKGLESIVSLPSIAERNRLGKRMREAMLPGCAVESVEAIRAAQELIKGDGGEWASLVVTQTNKASPDKRFLAMDLHHIIEGEVSGTDIKGRHYCPLSDSRRASIKDFVVNKETGVYAGFLDGKFSTFFPDSIVSELQLTEALRTPNWIVSKRKGLNIDALCEISIEEKSFYAIQHLQNSGASIRTCYPLFYAKSLADLDSEIAVSGGFSVKKEDVISHLQNEVLTHKFSNRIVFKVSKEKLLIKLDGVSGIPLPKGVYLFVDPKIIGYSSKP